MTFVPVVLFCDAGPGLWPVARELHPKPFIRLADGQSLLQKAFLRGASLSEVTHIVTVANREVCSRIEDEYREVNDRGIGVSFILEPVGRNTAAAVAAATMHVLERHGEEAVLLVLAADHLIADHEAFASAVQAAKKLARQGRVVTFGIRPDAPETGYGYIEADGHRVLRSVEKPDIERAREYLATGRYYWNSGMFCFSAGVMAGEMKRHCPDIWAAVRDCLERSRQATGVDFCQVELHADSFAMVPEDSIDHAVMQRSVNVVVVPCGAALKSTEHEAYELHRTVYRPWGSYTVLEEGDGYKVKRIVVRPGASLSLQMHQHRSEHWIVVGGTASVVNGETEQLLAVNESTYIPARCLHRLSNPGAFDLILIEVQNGDYLGEDDIVRLADDYGRC